MCININIRYYLRATALLPLGALIQYACRAIMVIITLDIERRKIVVQRCRECAHTPCQWISFIPMNARNGANRIDVCLCDRDFTLFFFSVLSFSSISHLSDFNLFFSHALLTCVLFLLLPVDADAVCRLATLEFS